MTLAPCVGIDLGGSNLRAALFRGSAPDRSVPVRIIRQAVGTQRDPQSVCAAIVALVHELVAGPDDSQLGEPAAELAPIAVGIGVAAMLRDRRGTVTNAPNLGWRDVAFGPMLAAALGPRFAVAMYNDVNAIAWGEFAYGAGRGARDMLAVFVGTGIGAGFIANSQLVEGTSSCAGELGHCKIAWGVDAVPCACGSRGCVEAYAGGASIMKRIQRDLADGLSLATVIAAGSIDAATPSHVDQAAADGDVWALELWQEIGTALAVAIGNALAMLNCERLVLGGGMLGRTPMLLEHMLTALEVVAPRAVLEPLTVVTAELGDDAGLIGAADLARLGVSIIR
ncbi:MAG: ROK family protein [Kofleriaceae bacterium]|nr:ROK family protein [Kofleriaceae bacterium]